jgi:hypothetical protein
MHEDFQSVTGNLYYFEPYMFRFFCNGGIAPCPLFPAQHGGVLAGTTLPGCLRPGWPLITLGLTEVLGITGRQGAHLEAEL